MKKPLRDIVLNGIAQIILKEKKPSKLEQKAKAIFEEHNNSFSGMNNEELEIMASYGREEMRPSGLIHVMWLYWIGSLLLGIYQFLTGGSWLITIGGLCFNIFLIIVLAFVV